MYQTIEFLPSSDTGSDLDDKYDLVSLDILKLELGIETDDEDERLDLLKSRASEIISKICGRDFPPGFALADAIETFQFRRGEGCGDPPFEQPLLLTHYPVIAISAVTIDGIPLDSINYALDPPSGRLFRINGKWAGKVLVYYEGGFDLPAAAPAALERAAIELVRDYRFSATREDPSLSIRSTTHGDTTVTYGSSGASSSVAAAGGVPLVVSELIKPYRRITV